VQHRVTRSSGQGDGVANVALGMSLKVRDHAVLWSCNGPARRRGLRASGTRSKTRGWLYRYEAQGSPLVSHRAECSKQSAYGLTAWWRRVHRRTDSHPPAISGHVRVRANSLALRLRSTGEGRQMRTW